MNIQFILMIIIFACAVFYVGRLVYKTIIPPKKGCSTGCNKCDVDFTNIEKDRK